MSRRGEWADEKTADVPTRTAIEELEAAIENLGDTITELVDRLRPVLEPDTPTTANTDPEAPHEVSDLRGLAGRLNGQDQRIRRLMERIDL